MENDNYGMKYENYEVLMAHWIGYMVMGRSRVSILDVAIDLLVLDPREHSMPFVSIHIDAHICGIALVSCTEWGKTGVKSPVGGWCHDLFIEANTNALQFRSFEKFLCLTIKANECELTKWQIHTQKTDNRVIYSRITNIRFRPLRRLLSQNRKHIESMVLSKCGGIRNDQQNGIYIIIIINNWYLANEQTERIRTTSYCWESSFCISNSDIHYYYYPD